MSDQVINLDSDDEIEISDTKFSVTSNCNDITDTIELNTSESDSEVEVVQPKRTAEIQNASEETFVPLTPQQLLRKQLADAAEKRLKRKIDQVDADSIDSSVNNKKNSSSFTTGTNLPLKSDNSEVMNKQSSRIRMISNPEYCQNYMIDGDVDTISLAEIMGSNDLVRTYQFNMLIDFDYLESFVSNKSCEFFLINKSDDDYLHIKPSSWEKFKIHTIDVSHKLPKFGTHHSKIMINFFSDQTCQIVIHTMNITEADHKIQTQMCWLSPRLSPHSDPSKYLDFNQPSISISDDTGTVFKRDFIAYLLTYENPDINKIIDLIAKYDFSPVDVVFVGSSPGKYEYQDWNNLVKPDAKPMFGYGRLWQVIHMLNLQSLSGKFIGQSSTIAGPCDNWKRNILVHMLTSCAEKGFPMIKKSDYIYKSGSNKLEPVIIWPTTEEILKSWNAPLSGVALHFTTTGKWEAYQRQYSDIRKYLYKWSDYTLEPTRSKAGRSNLAPHVKTYCVTEDNFKTLKWFLLTSANLSHQAWGKFEKFNLLKYTISSFEAGVFIAPKLLKLDNPSNKSPVLVPAYGNDTVENVNLLSDNKLKVAIRLPYDTPLRKYNDSDKPWSQPDSDKYFL